MGVAGQQGLFVPQNRRRREWAAGGGKCGGDSAGGGGCGGEEEKAVVVATGSAKTVARSGVVKDASEGKSVISLSAVAVFSLFESQSFAN